MFDGFSREIECIWISSSFWFCINFIVKIGLRHTLCCHLLLLFERKRKNILIITSLQHLLHLLASLDFCGFHLFVRRKGLSAVSSSLVWISTCLCLLFVSKWMQVNGLYRLSFFLFPLCLCSLLSNEWWMNCSKNIELFSSFYLRFGFQMQRELKMKEGRGRDFKHNWH